MTFIAISDESIPINLRPNFAAAKSVVPLPAKQSIIMLFSFEDCLIINSSITTFPLLRLRLKIINYDKFIYEFYFVMEFPFFKVKFVLRIAFNHVII